MYTGLKFDSVWGLKLDFMSDREVLVKSWKEGETVLCLGIFSVDRIRGFISEWKAKLARDTSEYLRLQDIQRCSIKLTQAKHTWKQEIQH